jgi:hypothetical protein
MIKKITFIIAFFIIATLKAQTTFDWDATTAAPIDNGDNVTQTIDGITTTFTIAGFNSVGVASGAAQDGSTGNVISSSIDSSEPSTPSTDLVFSFSEAVDITSIIAVTGPPITLTFTPTGGSNSAVVQTGYSGGTVNLNWTGVTSFIVTGSNAQFVIGFDDLIVSSTTLSANKFALQDVHVYPNPVNDMLYIDKAENIMSARVYNSLGQLVSETNDNKIDFRKFKSGVYILQINTDKESITKRIIKK